MKNKGVETTVASGNGIVVHIPQMQGKNGALLARVMNDKGD